MSVEERFIVSKGCIHAHLALPFLGVSEAEYHGGCMRQKRAAYLMAAGKQRDGEVADKGRGHTFFTYFL